MNVPTVPALLAASHRTRCAGPHRCYYCGAPADETHPASQHVKDSFTGRDGVAAPGSAWVCAGCVLCLREHTEVELIDGTRRPGQRMRGYSWVLTRRSAVAATKAHLDRLRAICLEPPEPPFAIVLSDSGQKHLLYRGVVNHDREVVTVTLEGESVTYRPGATGDLAARLDLCGHLIAATGKPALAEPISSRMAIAVMERYTAGEALLKTWDRVRQEPLSRLATWISPNKETCQDAYPLDIAPLSPV